MTATATALTEYDFVVLVDASGSMGEPYKGTSRWQYMQESLTSFVRDVEKLDADGIDLVVFSGTGVDSFTGVTADKVKEIFATRAPRSSTPLAQALQAGLQLAGKSSKKDFILVFTDGVPDDQAAAAKVLIDAANKQETDDALTVLFVQIGNDPSATAYLTKLDDGLTGAKFDIVDAKTIEEAEKFATTTDLILAAIAD